MTVRGRRGLLPQVHRLPGPNARAARAQIEQAADRECIVAHGLGRETPPRRARLQPVVGIAREQEWIVRALLAVGRRGHEQLHEALLLEATVHKLAGQPVE